MKSMSDSVPSGKSFYYLFFIGITILHFTFPILGDSKEIQFLRATDSALQTSIYTLVSKDTNIRLKIIGVVHVADKQYYLNIQKIINDLDFLYYEGIQVPPKSQARATDLPLSLIAQSTSDFDTRRSNKRYSDLKSEIARFLNFADQTDHLKPKSNWINADIDFSQFVELLETHRIGFNSISGGFARDSRAISKDYSEIMNQDSTKDSDYSLRVVSFKKKMSKNFVKSAIDLCYLKEMKLPREAIIIERNKVALSYLKSKFTSEIPLEIGLLYGVAHTPNFVEILTQEYNFAIESYEWLDAWSLQN